MTRFQVIIYENVVIESYLFFGNQRFMAYPNSQPPNIQNGKAIKTFLSVMGSLFIKGKMMVISKNIPIPHGSPIRKISLRLFFIFKLNLSLFQPL